MKANGADKILFNMGNLKIHYNGKVYEYLINTQLSDKNIDKIVEDILKHYPPDSTVEFDQLW